MKFRIEFTGDLMQLLDDDGNGYDAFLLHPPYLNQAEAQLDIWAGEYVFDAASAKRELQDLIRQM